MDVGHLAEDALAYLAAGGDPDPAAAEHLRECPGCAEALAALQTEPTANDPGVSPVEAQWFGEASIGVGDTVGRYRLTAVLGRGGMGVVFEAEDTTLARRVAIKIVRPSRRDAQATARIVAEGRALAALSHPNVVPVFDVGRHSGGVFLAMKRLHGRTARGWAEAERPGWRDATALYLAAGRGLQAAHDAGVIHRDFKPDNVLVGDDGSVVVLDFGLAAFGLVSSGTATSDQETPAPLHSPGGTRLTHTGSVLGTPVYMAPEQARGETVDERSDQYSFCASLYEAIYGERPFGDRRGSALQAAREANAFAVEPEGRRVPRRVRRAVLRGLQANPDDRWPSMGALLSALRPPARRPQRVAAVVSIGAVALALAAPSPGVSAAGQCTTTSVTASVWNARTKAAVQAAVTATGQGFAADTVQRASAKLDTFASNVQAVHVEVCGETDPRRRDHQRWCLDGRVDALRSLVTELSRADAATARNVIAATDALPSPSACLDPPSLRRAVELPADPSAAERVRSVRGRIAEARTIDRLGRAEDALALAVTTLEDAREVEFGPAIAEALVLVGGLRGNGGEIDTGRAVLTEAVFLAESIGDDRVSADAAVDLVWVEGVEFGNIERAEHWVRQADAALARIDDAEDIHIRLLAYRAMLAHAGGHFADAEALGRELLARTEALYGPEDRHVALALFTLAQVQGRPAETLELQQRALQIQQAVYGTEHPALIPTLNNLGEALFHAGRRDEAVPLIKRALVIGEASAGAVPRGPAHSHALLGAIAYARDKHDTALSHWQRAAALMDSTGFDEPLFQANLLNNLGTALEARGNHEEALRHFRDAARVFEANFGDNHVALPTVLRNAAGSLTALSRAAEARATLERAVAVVQSIERPEPAQLAATLDALARVQQQQGDHAEARRTMEAALRHARSAGAEQFPSSMLDEIEAWLREHPP